MGKNITIQEGGTPRTLGGVEKIVTDVVGGGTQNWIPEDEASNYVETGELTVSENGTYFSSDDGYVGYSKIDVRVTEGARLIEKEITENGTYNASDDDAEGYSKVEVDIDIPEPELITKSITENGTYDAGDDNADGYSSVEVNVVPTPGQVVPSTDSQGNTWASGNACLAILTTQTRTFSLVGSLTISDTV